MIGIFYHELGHAVIDTEDVPIFGQQEDAADVLSVLLIDETFIDADAQNIAFDAAFGYLNDPQGLEEVIYLGIPRAGRTALLQPCVPVLRCCPGYTTRPGGRTRTAGGTGRLVPRGVRPGGWFVGRHPR